jgi:MFS family permease
MSETDSLKTHDPYHALRFAEYRWYLVGTWSLSMAMLMQSAVMGWQVWGITGSALSLGLVGLAEALPCLGFTMLGGYAADRMDRRTLSLLSILALLVGGSILLVMNLHGAPAVAWPFYAIQALAGLGRAFNRPAMGALRTEVVPREAYANAAMWTSSIFQTAMVLGPTLGGLLIGWGSVRLAYGVEVVLILSALVATAELKPHPRLTPAQGGMFQSLKEGIGFVFSSQLLLGAMSLDLFAVLFGGAPALLPIFASTVLHVGAKGFGVLKAAPALGSVVVALTLAHRRPMARAGRALLLNVGLFGLCWIFFAYSKSFVFSLFLLMVSGAVDNVSVVVRQTLVQVRTPQALMGRVSAVSSFFITSSNEIGAFESGLAARLMGLIPSVVFGGLMTLGVVSFTAWKAPELRKLAHLTPEQ